MPAKQAKVMQAAGRKRHAGLHGANPPALSDRRELKKTSLELPAYVWDQVRTYLDHHPEQRVRQMIMAGFEALGLQIDPEDLVAERRRGPGG